METTPQNSGRSVSSEGAGCSFLLEAVGWYGTVAIVLAYLLLSLGLLDSSGLPYQALNLSGALGIILISLKKKAYQPAVLNVVWAVIALLAIGKTLF